MEKDDFLDDLHIGKIVEEIADHNRVSPKQIAEVICRYQNNAEKIFKLNDMNTEDVVKISYVLKYNLLEMLSEKYIPHLSGFELSPKQPYCIIEVNTKSMQCKSNRFAGNYDFLNDENIRIGKYIRNVAEEKGLNEQALGKLLSLSQSNISRLYHSKSITVKRMIRFSIKLEHNLFSKLYLSRIIIASSQSMLDHCTIKISEVRVDIINPKNGAVLKTFLPEKG